MDDDAVYAGDDFYCDVAIPHPERLVVVHESDVVLAFHHTRPRYKTHVVVVPKPHITSLATIAAADEAVVREVLLVVRDVARTVEASQGAARVVTNLGSYQESKHLHVHVVSDA